MDIDDRLPLLRGHVEDHPVAQDARDIDDDVDLAEGIDRLLNHPLGGVVIGDRIGIGDRVAARRLISAAVVAAGPVSTPCPSRLAPRSLTTTDAPSCASEMRDAPANPPARARDERDFPIKESHYAFPPYFFLAFFAS